MKLRNRGPSTNLLPSEVWHETFMYLTTADHRSLSLTCRLFNDISLPFIFESVSYSSYISLRKKDSPKVVKGRLPGLQKNIKALKALANSPKHAPLIKKCILSYFLYITVRPDKKAAEKGRNSYAPFVKTFVECLPCFVNLKEVEVKDFRAKMDEMILTVLASHPTLEKVSLTGVKFNVHILKPRIETRRFSIDNQNYLDSDRNAASILLDIFSGKKLESLDVWSKTYAPKLFQALTKQGTLECLSRLSFSIKSADLPDLYTFLSSCPNLEYIRMSLWRHYGIDADATALPPLPRSALPHLKSFSGPDVAVEAFIPGRPVTEVEIDPHYYGTQERLLADPRQIFLSLSQSTGPVTELHIETLRSTTEVLDHVTTYLPSLEVLDFSLELPGGDLQNSSELGADEDLLLQENYEEGGSACRNAYEDPIGGGHNLMRRYHFCHVHIHTDYMNLLHLVAHKQTELPPTIRSLFIHNNPFYKFEREGVPRNDEEEVEHVKKYGEPYTATMAQEMFKILSENYPALRSVVISLKHDDGFKWVRYNDGTWAYSSAFSLTDLQTGLIESCDDPSILPAVNLLLSSRF